MAREGGAESQELILVDDYLKREGMLATLLNASKVPQHQEWNGYDERTGFTIGKEVGLVRTKAANAPKRIQRKYGKTRKKGKRAQHFVTPPPSDALFLIHVVVVVVVALQKNSMYVG